MTVGQEKSINESLHVKVNVKEKNKSTLVRI